MTPRIYCSACAKLIKPNKHQEYTCPWESCGFGKHNDFYFEIVMYKQGSINLFYAPCLVDNEWITFHLDNYDMSFNHITIFSRDKGDGTQISSEIIPCDFKLQSFNQDLANYIEQFKRYRAFL